MAVSDLISFPSGWQNSLSDGGGRNFHRDWLTRFVRPIDLFSDSKGCIAVARNPVQRSASKHIDLADHYVREQQERGTINISYVSTKDMRADALTKHLADCDFQRHMSEMIHTVEL